MPMMGLMPEDFLMRRDRAVQSAVIGYPTARAPSSWPASGGLS